MYKLNINKILINTIFVLCFFPSLIYFLIPYETQPLYIFFSLIIILKTKLKDRKIIEVSIIFGALVTVYALISLAIYQENTINTILHSISYICPIILYISIYNNLNEVKYSSFLTCVIVWIIIGTVQALEFNNIFKEILYEAGKLMFSDRFLVNPTNDGRGSYFLASEPANSAPTIFLFMATSIFFYLTRGLSVAVVLGLASSIYMILLNKSATLGVLITSAFMVLIIISIIRKNIYLLYLLIAMSLICGFGYIGLYDDLNSRLILFIVKLTTLYQEEKSLFDIALEVGTARLMPLLLGYYSLLDNYGLGHGVASWSVPGYREIVQFSIGMEASTFTTEGYSALSIPQNEILKPQSYLSIIAFDLGLIGIVLVIYLTYIFAGLNTKKNKNLNSYVFLIPGFLWIMLFGMVTLPMPWILFAYANHLNKKCLIKISSHTDSNNNGLE